METGWNPWGTLPHFLPQQIATEKKSIEMAKDLWKNPDPEPSDFDAELDQAQVEIHKGNPEAALSISRATEMRSLLRHVRPHGGNAGEQVKRMRPRSTRD